MTQITGGLINTNDAVLILIDFQPKLTLACRTLEPEIIVGNSIALAEVGAAFKLPIITTGGREGDPYNPDVIAAAGPTRVHVERHTINAWLTPEFKAAVEKTGRRTLIMAGITTDLCVLLPALSAQAAGYTVQVVADASGCFTQKIEDVSLMRLRQAGVAVTTWASLAGELMGTDDWQQGVGPNVMQSFGKHHASMGLIGAMRAQRG